LATKAPSPTNVQINPPAQNRKNKRDLFKLKISDISKSLQNQQENEVQEKIDEREIVEIDDEETNQIEEEEEEEEQVTRRRSKRSRNRK
jgi:hypothetical protein